MRLISASCENSKVLFTQNALTYSHSRRATHSNSNSHSDLSKHIKISTCFICSFAIVKCEYTICFWMCASVNVWMKSFYLKYREFEPQLYRPRSLVFTWHELHMLYVSDFKNFHKLEKILVFILQSRNDKRKCRQRHY